MAARESVPSRKILVVDDEEYITDLLSTSLRFQGFEVATAGAGLEALSAVQSFGPDLIMLDVNMADIDGFEVCRRLRSDGDLTPVIFLTAKDTKEDMLSGFTKGGDDYMTKPFSLEEVVARIQAVLRRSGTAPADDATVHRYADLVMDDDTHRATRDGELVELSPTEWKLLRYLLMNAERVLSKSQILDHVWQYDFGGDASSVETYISYLRKKIDRVDPKLIQTVRGVGYTIRTGD
ncbi:response regulator transcription factor [Ilumatobacter nonamiensis]|uniref:response regulator transcription factor n=1 Tax=Ilumatobacter nonamiensis TaxID=467093 RepID=UPI00034B9BF7|nr:response regulator transcription factor [Ilumatobacter nonamiensis]